MIQAIETVVIVVLLVCFCSLARGAGPARAVPPPPSPESKTAPLEAPAEAEKAMPLTPLSVKDLDEEPASGVDPTAEQSPAAVPETDNPASERPAAILREIIKGISEGDYAMYTRNFSDQLKVTQKREDFLQLQRNIQKKLGVPKSLDYLGFYLQEGSKIILFKAKFGKHRDDVLIRLVLDKDTPNPKVTGLWFDSPALEK